MPGSHFVRAVHRVRYPVAAVCGLLALVFASAILQVAGWIPRITVRTDFIPGPGYDLGMTLATLFFIFLAWFVFRVPKH